MKFSLDVADPKKYAHICQIIGIFTDGKLTGTAETLNKLTQGAIANILKQKLFTGKLSEVLSLYQVDKKFTRILLVGCGDVQKLTLFTFRKIILSASQAAKTSPIAISYLTELPVARPLAWKVRQIVEATAATLYEFNFCKSKKEPTPACKELLIHINNVKEKNSSSNALREGQAIADGMNLAKNLGNLPSNICTPTFLAEEAQAIAKRYKNLTAKILDEAAMKKLKMGALLAVSQGSAEPAQLICLEYYGTHKKAAPIALVGKGVTFDTGGISLKPADSMVGMKYDMCGAASVMGTLMAAAELKLPINVIGIVAAVENMPGGTAYKPEDILTSMSGQTIEVISTDAEGRLALCDAMTYCERYHPAVVIDIATLTGAVIIALGFHASGLLANDETLAKDLLKAGIESNDRAWQLPLWDDYQEQLKSPFADMSNLGGRPAGAITAGCFLSRFANKFKWAHLDVAGTAAIMMNSNDRFATGRPVPLLTQYLIDRAQHAD